MKLAAQATFLAISAALFAASTAAAASGSSPPPYRATGAATDAAGKATGFFHVERIDGLDWVVDPAGRGMVLCGVDWCWAKGMYSEKAGCAPYGRFVRENYPDVDAWAEETAGRLRSWGFNFLAVGTSPELEYRSMAHANGSEALYFSNHFCRGGDPDLWIAKSRNAPGTQFPNVFHPRFAETCEELARKRCAPHKDDPWLVGYFIDNELAWRGNDGSDTGLFNLVAALPPEHSARKALEGWLAARNAQKPVDDALKREFVALVAERYFSAMCSAIRKADPNHMILGCRFAGLGHPREILLACGRHCDVVSLNVYPWADPDNGTVFAWRDDPPLADSLRAFHEKTGGKPVLLTEWSFPALDSGLPCTYGAGQRFRTQDERAAASEMFLKTVLALPFVIGHDFFMWQDDPPLGFNDDFRENSNYGLVNLRNEPYGKLVDMFARVHAKAVNIHRGGPSCGDAAIRPRSGAGAAGDVPASERERYFARKPRSPEAGNEVTCIPPASDGKWTLDNGKVRISGRVGARLMADEIAFRGRLAGRWNAMLEHAEGGKRRWTGASRVTEAVFSRDEKTGIDSVTIRSEGGGEKPFFAITTRLSLAPGEDEILAEIVSLENIGDKPLAVRHLMMRPFAAERRPEADPETVPDLWKGPAEGYWRLSDGSRFGIASTDPGVESVALWSNRGSADQHPDVRCLGEPPFALAPKETWKSRLPTGARLRMK